MGQVGPVGFVSTKSGLGVPISYYLAYSVDNSTWTDYEEDGLRKVFEIYLAEFVSQRHTTRRFYTRSPTYVQK